jgi:hypothetical protein
MAGLHRGGSDSLGFLSVGGGANTWSMHFMPKNDKAYAEGRQARFIGRNRDANPFGADEAAAALINQVDAWLVWDWGWNLNGPGSEPSFQLETATPVLPV